MGTFDWDSFIDNLWERENAKGKRGVEGKGGYRNGKYYPYTTPNGNTDIGPGFDLKFQTPEFRERAKKGFTKAELDSIVKSRLQSEIGKFNQKITKLGGDSSSIPDNVYAGLLDMQWQLGSGLYDNYPNFWRAVANQNYEGMRRESVVTYKDSKGNRHVDTGRRNFRNNTYFTDPIVKEILEIPTEPVDALRVYNPYPTQVKSTVFVPPTVPDEDSYVNTRQLTQQEDASNRFNNAVEAYQNLNRIMDATSIQNTAAPRYVPKNAPYVAKRHSEGGFLQPKDAWDALSMQAKADVMRVAIKHGLYNLDDIRKKYNEFAEGGSKEEAEEANTEKDYINTMERVAEENYKKWGFSNPDEALLHALNDNTYNYRGYYSKYPQSKANADTHWTDEFKTVYHPTFSNESIYSGKVSQYNPQGIVGGFWANDTFIPSVQQVMEESKIPLLDYLTNEYKNGGGIHIKPENRGKFTALKKRTGHSATWFKEHGTPAQKKMAVFALNSRKWKHGDGGNLFYPGGYVRDSNNNPISFDDDGNLTDQVTGEKGTMMLPEVTVTGRDLSKPYYSSFDGSSQPYIDLFSALSKGMQPLSLSQHVGAAADAIQGKKNYFDSLFNGNSGFFTDKYTAEHPWVSTLGNMAGDIVTGAAITKLSPLTNRFVTGNSNIVANQDDLIQDAMSVFLPKKTLVTRELSKADKEAGYQRMIDFISSPEYQKRLDVAGLGDYRDYMINLIEKRLNKGDFPAKEADVVAGRKTVKGVSEMNPFSREYGVTVKRGLDNNDFLNVFDHELAHWTTKNTQTGLVNDIVRMIKDMKIPDLKLQKIMEYNDEITPMRSWEEISKLRIPRLSKAKPGEWENLRKKFLYRQNGQERRSMAYAMTQEAKRRGISTDELVDMYTVDGDIMGEAPQQLQDLSIVYSPENMKKFLKGFLSVTAPVAMGLNIVEDDSR